MHLDAATVCARLGWQPATLYRALWVTRRKVRDGQPLAASDIPLPRRIVGRSPLWADRDIAEFLRNRGSQRPSTALRVPAADIRVSDRVIIANHPDGPELGATARRARARSLVVLATDAEARPPRALLATRKREPGAWHELTAEVYSVYRVNPGT
jgi:hypothetical protein